MSSGGRGGGTTKHTNAHESWEFRILPWILLINSDEDGRAGASIAWAGGVFAGPLPSKLEDGP